jgi:hypothetical protein
MMKPDSTTVANMDFLASIQVRQWGWLDFGLSGIVVSLILLAFVIFLFLFFRNRPRSKPE